MDVDLHRIARRALEEAQAAGRDYQGPDGGRRPGGARGPARDHRARGRDGRQSGAPVVTPTSTFGAAPT